ncbi:MAG: Lrp/AsnC family transcriptional regulator [Saprospiraceae bacterium]
MIKLDAIDRKLLKLLQEDSKRNIKTLATELGITKTPIYERIKRLEQGGVIAKYVAILDKVHLPAYIVVFCSVSLDSQKLDEINSFSKAIEAFEEVTECYLMGGQSDFLLKVVVEDLTAYHLFSSGKLAAIDNVSQIRSSFVFNEVKTSSVLPVLNS